MLLCRLACVVAVAAVPLGCGGKTPLYELAPAEAPSDAGHDGSSDAGAQKPDSGVSPEASADGSSPDAIAELACPVQPPALAAPCSIDGQVCSYSTGKTGPCDDVGTDDRQAFRCEGGAWLEIARCVEWGACPSEAPQDGAACATLGLDCFYSTDGCQPSGIVQCSGPVWRHVNACAPRTMNSCFGWNAVLPEPESYGTDSAGAHDISYPAIALAGTQALATWHFGGGDESEHSIRGVVAQTAAPSMAGTWSTQSTLLGRDAVTNPRVSFFRDRFVLAWGANDGWPIHTDGQPGTFVRSLPLNGELGPDLLIDPWGQAPTGVALGPVSGWVGWRAQSPTDATKYAASVARLDSSYAPVAGSAIVVADEGLQEWFAPPIPNATVRPLPLAGGGFALVFPAPASGDLWDDSGIVVNYYDPGATQPYAFARAAVGLPNRVAAAPLADHSVLVAYTLADGYAPDNALLRLAVVHEDTTWDPVTAIYQSDETLAWGPKLVPMDDGVLLAWSTAPKESPGYVVTLHIWSFDPDGAQGSSVDVELPGMPPSETFDVAYAEVDRSLHAVWSPVWGVEDKVDRVLHQRWVCGVGIK